MTSNSILPPLVKEDTQLNGVETLPRRTSSRRFATRSAIRSRGRRNSSKKVTCSKSVLPRIQTGDQEGAKQLNLEIQQQKLSHALENPNIVKKPISLYPRRLNYTAISGHTKFLSQPPSNSLEYPGKSPYVMDDDSAHRYFMSGYQGVVPRYRFLCGASFPFLTHDAINEFTQDLRTRAKTFSRPIDMTAPSTAPQINGFDKSSRCVLYRSDSGIIPNYKGHIPGHKFRFGHTFGEITKNARELEITSSGK